MIAILSTGSGSKAETGSSGYSDGSLAQNGVLKPGTVLVNKPFTIKALTAKLREVLRSA